MNIIYQRTTDQLARLAIYIALFALPFSRFIVNQALLVALVCVLIHGEWRARWQHIWQFKFFRTLLLFMGLLIVGIIYSQTTLSEAIQGLGKYSKLLFIPFFLPLFADTRARSAALIAFLAGVYVCMALNSLHYYSFINLNVIIAKYQLLFTQPNMIGSFINPIPVSVLEAFAGFILLHKSFSQSRLRWLYLILLAVGMYHLFFINPERTGMLCFACLIVVFFLQHVRWQTGLLLSVILLPAAFLSLYYYSHNFAERIELVKTDIAAYQAGSVHTSTGLRFSFWQNSWLLIKKSPFLGTGTGSFKAVYAKTGAVTAEPNLPLSDPHNEYILILVQWGLLGLLLYLTWIGVLYKESQQLPTQEKRLMQGLLVTILVSSLTHVVIYTNATGTLFVLGICIFFATRVPHQRATV